MANRIKLVLTPEQAYWLAAAVADHLRDGLAFCAVVLFVVALVAWGDLIPTLIP